MFSAFRKRCPYALRLSAVLAAFSLAIVCVAGQGLSPGEVRIHSQPYQPQSQVLRAESNLVRVAVVVRTHDGRIVSGLKPEDFAILDNGKKQSISAFTVQTRTPISAQTTSSGEPIDTAAPLSTGTSSATPSTPRYVALYFDDLHMRSGDLKHVQLAAENFVRSALTVHDNIALFAASSSEAVDFTSDASKISSAISKMKSHERVFDGGTCPRMTPHDAYVIANHLDPEAYNTALAAAKECNCGCCPNLNSEA